MADDGAALPPADTLDVAVERARAELSALLAEVTEALYWVTQARGRDEAADARAEGARRGRAVARHVARLRAGARGAFEMGGAAEDVPDEGLEDARERLRAEVRRENESLSRVIEGLRHLHRDVSIIVEMKARGGGVPGVAS